MSKPQEIMTEKRHEILSIAARHGAHNVRVFGSVARGEADEQSDIDLLVEFERGRSLLDHTALLLELQETLGVSVDVVSDRGIKPPHSGACLARGCASMRDTRERLRDILEAIEWMERQALKGRQAFDEDELIQI